MALGSGKDQPAADVELRPAWRRADAAIEADAIAFWRRLAILPAGVAPEQRAAELAVAAYRGGRLAGVTTVVIEPIERLRARFAFFRAAVDPAERRTHVAIALAVATRDLLESWSAEHPAERVAGLAAIVENREIDERLREPYWPVTRLGLVGFTPEGRQVRVAWFDHFRFG